MKKEQPLSRNKLKFRKINKIKEAKFDKINGYNKINFEPTKKNTKHELDVKYEKEIEKLHIPEHIKRKINSL